MSHAPGDNTPPPPHSPSLTERALAALGLDRWHDAHSWGHHHRAEQADREVDVLFIGGGIISTTLAIYLAPANAAARKQPLLGKSPVVAMSPIATRAAERDRRAASAMLRQRSSPVARQALSAASTRAWAARAR